MVMLKSEANPKDCKLCAAWNDKRKCMAMNYESGDCPNPAKKKVDTTVTII